MKDKCYHCNSEQVQVIDSFKIDKNRTYYEKMCKNCGCIWHNTVSDSTQRQTVGSDVGLGMCLGACCLAFGILLSQLVLGVIL